MNEIVIHVPHWLYEEARRTRLTHTVSTSHLHKNCYTNLQRPTNLTDIRKPHFRRVCEPGLILGGKASNKMKMQNF